ncbi:5-hydroxytryptamine receptor 1E-like [Lytechinus pictus]|uniref:5-hydroxytryptamine receptor 1E-like n=1 Tax=Lytechinus pictus TaxID=7653 RepID=UPI0030B9F8C0
MESLGESLNDSDTHHVNPSAARIVLVCCLYLPFAALTVTGNIFVLVAYKRDERIRKNSTNTYILNLAIADLLVGLVMLVNAPTYVTDDWYFGQTVCIIVWAIDFTSTDMSVITIIAISLDRYLMVRNTMRHRARQSRRRIAQIFIVVWTACLFIHLCIAFLYSAITKYKYLKYQTCNLEYRRDKILVISMFLVEFVVPVTCLFLLNTKVFMHIHRQGSRIKLSRKAQTVAFDPTINLGKDTASGLYEPNAISLTSYRVLCSQSGITYEVPTCVDSFEPSSYAQTILSDDLRSQSTSRTRDNEIRVHRFAQARSRHHKAAKLLTALLIVFIISWLPYYIYDCIVLINGEESANEAVTQILTFILWGNSAVNPLLYAFTNIHYKQNFMQFLHLRKGMHVINERPTFH